MEEKSWRRNYRGENHVGRIMGEEPWKRNLGGEFMEEESCRRNHV